MKKIAFFVILFVIQTQLFSQELLPPLTAQSFGLNQHTNRDIPYFTHVDSNKNTLIVGTTEKDSTFTDVIVTKLNQTSDLVWQKTISIATNLSYDIPVKSFISNSNELYVVGRSSYNQSTSNGLIFIIKYAEDGSIIYNKTITNANGSDYVDYRYMEAQLREDGTLNLVYSPIDYGTYESNTFNFLEISNSGAIENYFTLEIPYNAVKGFIKNDKYYFLVQEVEGEYDVDYFYKFYQIDNNGNIEVTEITDTTFIDYYSYASITTQVNLTQDFLGNTYLTCFSSNNNTYGDRINVTKIDDNNSFLFSTNTLDTESYNFVNSFINEDNENIVIANDTNTNEISFLKVTSDNTLQSFANASNILATGFKQNNDGSFFITTSNSNIRLFSNDLLEQNSFYNSDSYELRDFVKVDEQTITAVGTSYEKMFPESEYYTQLDIQSETIKGSQILNNYSFSGSGTSYAFQQRIIVDNEDNYLVLVTEKLGPEYLGVGGTNPPLNKRIIKYDSDLNKIWESEVPDHIFNLVSHGRRDIFTFIDNDNNLYLNLPRSGDQYGLGYDLYKVNPNGDFTFINHSFVASEFHSNDNLIFMAQNYFGYEDSSELRVLDKNNGEVLDLIDVGHEVFIKIFSIDDDYYFYTSKAVSNNTPDYIYLYKNGEKILTRSLSNNYGIYPNEVDANGTIFFATENGSTQRINRLKIDNSFSSLNTSDDISSLKLYDNGKVFIYLEDDSTLVLNNNLSVVAQGDAISSYRPYLIALDNHIVFGNIDNNRVLIINDLGETVDSFKIAASFHKWYTKFDSEGNLIVVGSNGNRISTFNEYAWSRGYIKKYESWRDTLNIENISDESVQTKINIFPNPTSGVINIDLESQKIDKVIVRDISGKKLRQHDKNIIDLSDLSAGIYFLEIHTKTKHVITSKAIKL